MPWKRVKVGSILKVFDDEDFPADLLCLYCSLADSICYIKTTNLDGGVRLRALVHHPCSLNGMNAMAALLLLSLPQRPD